MTIPNSATRPHSYVPDEQKSVCRTCGYPIGSPVHSGAGRGAAPSAPPRSGPDSRVVGLLAVIAVMVGIGVFWVIATPHEQCYIGDPDEGRAS